MKCSEDQIILDEKDIILTDAQHQAIRDLKDLMNECKTIYFQQDEVFLTKHLRCTEWDAAKAIARIKTIYKIKKNNAKWFALKNVAEYADTLSVNHRYMLEDRDKNGRRVLVYKLGNATSSTKLEDVAQLDEMWYEAMLMEPITQINGISIIMDCQNLSLVTMKWLTPGNIKIGAAKANILPVKYMDVHVVNTSTFVNAIMKLITPFLSKYTLSRFHFHQTNWPALHEYVGKDCLPEEYGGPAGKIIDYEKSYKFLYDVADKLAENRKYGII